MSEIAELAQIEIDARAYLFAPLSHLQRVKIRIDGTLYVERWGRHRYWVTPGRHEVHLAVRRLLGSDVAQQVITIDADPEALVSLRYHAARGSRIEVSYGAASSPPSRYIPTARVKR
jgi:hypothetical protein